MQLVLGNVSKWQLFNLMTLNEVKEVLVVPRNGANFRGVVQAIRREDGSGSSFIVTVLTAGNEVRLYVRTID